MKTRYKSWLRYKHLNKSQTFLYFSFFCDHSKCPQPWLHKQNHPRQESARQKRQGRHKTWVYWFKLPHHLITDFCFLFLGPCGLLQDIPFICPGPTSLSLSKIGLRVTVRPPPLKKHEPINYESDSAWLLRILPNPLQSMEKSKHTCTTHSLNASPTSLHWLYWDLASGSCGTASWTPWGIWNLNTIVRIPVTVVNFWVRSWETQSILSFSDTKPSPSHSYAFENISLTKQGWQSTFFILPSS